MTAPGLESIELGLWRELARLLPGYVPDGATDAAPALDAPALPTSARPFRHLRRFAGDLNQFFSDEVEKGLVALRPDQLPVAFLAFLTAKPTGASGAIVDTILGEREVVPRSTWRIFVATGDLRGNAHAMVSDIAGQPAALLCAQRVMEILDGLHVPGMRAGRGVEWGNLQGHLIVRRTTYVYAVDVMADFSLHPAEASSATSVSVPLETMTGTNGPEDLVTLDPSSIDLT